MKKEKYNIGDLVVYHFRYTSQTGIIINEWEYSGSLLYDIYLTTHEHSIVRLFGKDLELVAPIKANDT